MGTEIERKFLVRGDEWRGEALISGGGRLHRQGYLSTDENCIVRVRVVEDAACLTVKGRPVGITRQEFEYPIPLFDAEAMLAELAQKPLVEKIRYAIPYKSNLWTVDEFLGANKGLITAEIELRKEEENFTRPPWLGAEVSYDPRYFNVNLVRAPYQNW